MAIERGSRAAKCVAASSIISPAPTNSTRVSRRSSNSWAARRTAAAAMLMECAPISVALRTSLATANERWNSWFKRAAERAGGLGGAHRVLHLAQDLRLAQHHRVEAAGDAEGVARHVLLRQRVGVRAQHGRRDAAAVRQPAQRVVERGMVGGAVDLGAVARRDDGGLDIRVAPAAEGAAQALQRGRDLVEREREAATQVERRGRVVQAQGPDCHMAAIIKSAAPRRAPRCRPPRRGARLPSSACPHRTCSTIC